MNERMKEGRKEEGRKEWMNAKSTCIFHVYFSSVFLFGRKHPLTEIYAYTCHHSPDVKKKSPTLAQRWALQAFCGVHRLLLWFYWWPSSFGLWEVRGTTSWWWDVSCQTCQLVKFVFCWKAILSRCRATPMIAKLAIRSVLCRLKNIPVWVFHCADDVTGWSF